jgi:hypothetical protein
MAAQPEVRPAKEEAGVAPPVEMLASEAPEAEGVRAEVEAAVEAERPVLHPMRVGAEAGPAVREPAGPQAQGGTAEPAATGEVLATAAKVVMAATPAKGETAGPAAKGEVLATAAKAVTAAKVATVATVAKADSEDSADSVMLATARAATTRSRNAARADGAPPAPPLFSGLALLSLGA